MYLVELQQADRRHVVGLFEEEKDARDWIESIPYVEKEVSFLDEQQFLTYTMAYDDLPLYEEIIWKKSRYPLTKYMFTPDDGQIELLIWDQLPLMNQAEGRVIGMTQVDAYMIPNEETEQYIQAREEVRKAITDHFEKIGKQVEAGGIGSQDGEYLLVEDGPLIHLDALTVKQWEEKMSVEDFIQKIVG